jgi:signal transduction histidine kinase
MRLLSIEWKIREKLVVGAALALLLLGISGFLLYQNTSRLIEISDWVSETHETVALHDELLASLADAESGLFGFIITGTEEFLAPYHAAANRIEHRMSQLGRLSQNAEEQAGFNQLRDLIEQRLAFIEHRLEARRQEGLDAAIKLVQKGEAKAVMDSIRNLLAERKQAQQDLLAERKADALGRAQSTLALVIIFGVFSIALLGIVFVLLFFENHRRSISESELRRARDGLEIRVQERTAELGCANAALKEEIAAHKEAAAALRKSEVRLSELARTLEEKNRELEMIVYIASHDLRSPLVNVQGFSMELACICKRVCATVERLQSDSLEVAELKGTLDEVPEAVEYIQSGVARMDLLLSGFLRFSRVGHAALQIEPLRMNRLLDRVVQAMDFQIGRAGARLKIEKLPDCLGDRTQVTQVFSNLIDNALKYRDKTRPLNITVSGAVENGKAIYWVRDTGMGIAPQHRQNVFEIFQRLSPSTSEGEGLGLAIAKKIIERQNGAICISESAPGHGSVFKVVLPAVQIDSNC